MGIISGGFNTINIKKVKYLFIDGASLNSILQEFSQKLFGGLGVQIDYSLLASGYKKVFYYDSLPAQKKNESESDYQIRFNAKQKILSILDLFENYIIY